MRFLFPTLLAALAVVSPIIAAAAEEVVVDGVLHVKNGAKPSQGVESMELEELWRIGGDDEDSVLIGTISQALVDDQNNIYLLDAQLSHVEVFSPEGEHIKTLGREGSGPGEFNAAFDMVFMPDGTLGVVQSFPGKIIKLNLDGTPAGEYQPDTGGAQAGGFLVLVNVLGTGTDLILTGMKITIDPANGSQTRSYFIRRFDGDQQQVHELAAVDRVWDFRDFTYLETDSDWVWSRIALGADGKVVTALPRNGYEITVFNPDGSTDRIIEREYEPWQRSQRAKDRMDAFTQGLLLQFPPNTPYENSDVEQDIEAMYVQDDGSIWCLSSRAMWEPKPGVLHTYDVFSAEGEFIKQVDVRCEGSSDRDLLVFTKDDLVFQVTGFFEAILAMQAGGAGSDESEAEPMEVICYRVK
jgi:6-bladed beta-propeller